MTTQIDGEWLQYELPSQVVIQHYQLGAFVSIPNAEQPYSWNLVASNDGSTWTNLDTRTRESYTLWENNGNGPTRYNTFTMSNIASFRYYRIIFTSTDPNAIPIGQLRIYGFNLISGGSFDGNGFLVSGSGGTLYPGETLTSSSQNGYVTSQSANWYFTQFSEPPTYQYHGLYVLSVNTGQTTGAIDTTVYTGINSYTNALTSSPYNSGYPPAYGSSSVPGEWLQIKFPTAVVPSYVQLAAVYQNNPYTVILLGSLDGASWIPIISITDNQGNGFNGTTSYLTVNCQTTAAYSYYRLAFPIGDLTYTNAITMIGFNIISGGTVDANGFLNSGSGGTVYPTEVLTSSSQNGYVTSQSSGFDIFLDAAGSSVGGSYIITTNAPNQTLDSLVNTRVSMSTYNSLYDQGGYYMGDVFSPVQYASTAVQYTAPTPICFLEGSMILCFNLITNQEGYRPIETLRNGDFVKTLFDGYKRIDLIGHSKIYNPGHTMRSTYWLYRCPKENYPFLLHDDLIITGCHSILVQTLTTQERQEVIDVQGAAYVTDRLYRLPACVDRRTVPFEQEGLFTIWHLALEHPDPYMNYGIYANGLVVETTSRRMMLERSGMELIE